MIPKTPSTNSGAIGQLEAVFTLGKLLTIHRLIGARSGNYSAV
jgi:hypothetical protein